MHIGNRLPNHLVAGHFDHSPMGTARTLTTLEQPSLNSILLQSSMIAQYCCLVSTTCVNYILELPQSSDSIGHLDFKLYGYEVLSYFRHVFQDVYLHWKVFSVQYSLSLCLWFSTGSYWRLTADTWVHYKKLSLKIVGDEVWLSQGLSGNTENYMCCAFLCVCSTSGVSSASPSFIDMDSYGQKKQWLLSIFHLGGSCDCSETQATLCLPFGQHLLSSQPPLLCSLLLWHQHWHCLVRFLLGESYCWLQWWSGWWQGSSAEPLLLPFYCHSLACQSLNWRGRTVTSHKK